MASLSEPTIDDDAPSGRSMGPATGRTDLRAANRVLRRERLALGGVAGAPAGSAAARRGAGQAAAAVAAGDVRRVVPSGFTRAGAAPLVDLHPDFSVGLTEQQMHWCRSALVLPAVRIAPGPFDVEALEMAAEATGEILGVFVIDGIVLRETLLGKHRSAQLYGPGDLLAGRKDAVGLLAPATAFAAMTAATVTVLDDRAASGFRRWPPLATSFFVRAMRQVERAREHQAISQLARVEDRLLALFWALAERWGRVRSDGIVIELALTHETIGRLVGARRSTVSLGLRALADEGLLLSPSSGSWVIATDSIERLTSGRPGTATRRDPAQRAVA